MKSLMTLTGILAFSFSSFSIEAADFACPVPSAVSSYTCSGTVRVQSMAQLNAYKNDLGVVASAPTVAKSILIDFNPDLTEELVIATPCMVKTSPSITLTTTANVCFNGKKGILIDENFNFTGKNLKVESNETVTINKNSIINAQNIRLLSLGSVETNQAYIRDGAKITAANLSIESLYKGFVGRNSDVKLTGTLGIYSRGDEEASIRESAKVEAAKIEIPSSNITTIANLTTLTAPEITLSGANGCNISKGASITAATRLGNCFLTSLTQEKFSIDKNRGNAPLTVNFNASTISETVTGYVWNFGDGQTETTYTPTVSHTYAAAGSYTATLMYATLANLKGQKSAGSLQIDVQAAPVVPTTPPRGNFSYAQDGTFVYLKAFIRKTQFDIASAYYVIDDNQNNKIYMTNFYQNSISSVEMNTFGTHKVTMYVEDIQGQKYNTTMMIDLKQNEDNIAPVVRFYGEQSAPRTAFINMASSFIPYPDEFLKDFKVEFGDGQVLEVHDAVSVVHTYAAPGTYNVKVTAEFNGNERFAIIPVTVTNDNKAALSPVAAFDYHLFDFAGNVTFNDDRSATPNGEIISYVWNFGDGTQAYGKLVSHFFGPGDHVVSLTVTDTMGLTSTQRQMISIAEPGDDIVSNLSCWKDGDKKIACDVFALDKFDEITRVRVQWGDGTSVNLTNQAEIEEWGLYFAEHVYQNYGTYNLRLTVDTARGQTKYAYASETFSGNVPVNLPPVASVQCNMNFMQAICNGLASYDPEGGALSFTIDWGDNTGIVTNATSIFSHLYSQPGSYNITLTATDDRGFSSQTSLLVVALTPTAPNTPPIAGLSCSQSRPLTLDCNSFGSVDHDGGIILYEFIYDDGTIDSNGAGFSSYTFASNGEKTVKLIVTDDDGAQSEKTISVNVWGNTSPIIESISCSSATPLRLICYASAFDNDEGDTIINYIWDMGDGTEIETSFPAIPEHQYNVGGEKIVKLTVSDQYGGITSSQYSINVKVNTPPIANFICTTNEEFNYWCSSSSSDIDGNIVTYKWEVNGQIFFGNSLIYKFVNGGSYSIKLSVTDDLGAESTSVQDVTINKPIASFSCTESGPIKLKCSINSAAINEDEIVYSRFEFGQEEILEGDNVEYEFSKFGTYKIKLVIATANEATAEVEQYFTFTSKYLPPKAAFKYDVDPGLRTTLEGEKSTHQQRVVVKYTWDFGDQSDIEETTSSAVIHSYQNEGFYNVKLTVVDNQGNQSNVVEKIYIYTTNVFDPGPANDDDILGIDSDNNGIRDDIQRWVAFEAKDNQSMKTYLSKLAKHYQDGFVSYPNLSSTVSYFKYRERAELCLRSMISDEDYYDHIISFIDVMNSNTEARAELALRLEGKSGGLISEAMNSSGIDYSSYCSAL